VVLTIGYGRLPWISLCLAFSFATYGLVKKKVNLGGVESLAAETAIQFLPALGFLVWLGMQGEATFAAEGAGHAALLASAGIVTALPLVCFGAAAIRVPLSTIGLLQYMTPVFQFLLGVFYFHEEMPPERWAGFALVWLALALLTGDALRTARRTSRTLTTEISAPSTTRTTGTTSAARKADRVASGPDPVDARP
jgi:chloramphenicol-sensitive protein RarD